MKTKRQIIQEKRREYERKRRKKYLRMKRVLKGKLKKKEVEKPKPAYVRNPKEIPASVFAPQKKKSWFRKLLDWLHLWYNRSR